MTCAFLLQGNIYELSKLNRSDNGFMDNVVDRAMQFLRGGSLEITLTVPLKSNLHFLFL